MNGSGFRGAPPGGGGAAGNQPPNMADMASALRTHHPALAQYLPRLETLASSLYNTGDLSSSAAAAACRLLPPHLSALQAAVAASSNIPQTTAHHGVQPGLLSQLHPAATAAAVAAAAAAAAANQHSMAAAAAAHHPLLSPFLYPHASASRSAQAGVLPQVTRHFSYGPPIDPFIPSTRYRYPLPTTISPPGTSIPLASSIGRPSVVTGHQSLESESGPSIGASATARPTPIGGLASSGGGDTRSVERRPSVPTPVTAEASAAATDSRSPTISGDQKSRIATALPTQPYYPSHFMKGTVIQLASGELKRVEDLSSEDFIKSANLTGELKIDTSRVVSVDEKSNDIILLTFAVGENKVQVSVEATMEHPFFVLGQGWSSYNPERSRNLYGLICKRLQIGDVCISLTHRDLAERGAADASAHFSTGGQRASVLSSSYTRHSGHVTSKVEHGSVSRTTEHSVGEELRRKRKRTSPCPSVAPARMVSTGWTGQQRSAITPPADKSVRSMKRRRWSIQ